VFGNLTRLAQFYRTRRRVTRNDSVGFVPTPTDPRGIRSARTNRGRVTRTSVHAAQRFRGTIEQTRRFRKEDHGLPAYKLARKKKEVSLARPGGDL